MPYVTAVSYTHLDVYKRQHVYTHEIDVTDENKFMHKTYPIPLYYQKIVAEEIKKMLDDNIIERSNSNFLNPMVIVKKKKITK